MEDLVARTIEIGRLPQCPKKRYTSDTCLPLRISLGQDEGFLCVGFCKGTRPIDCIKLCGTSSGELDFVEFAMSPMEALAIANFLIEAVGTFITTGEMLPKVHGLRGYDRAEIIRRLEELYLEE